MGDVGRWTGAYLFRRHRLLRGLMKLFNGLRVKSQVFLAANQDDGQALAEVQDFGDPLVMGRPISIGNQPIWHVSSMSYLLLHIVKRVWGVDGETDKDDV